MAGPKSAVGDASAYLRQEVLVNRTVKSILSLAAVTVLAAGCHNNPPASTANSQGPLTPMPAPAPMAQPAAYETSPAPIQSSGTIDTATPSASSDVSAPLAAAGGNYTVQPHDTLYHIAVKHYGDGKQWKKIAAANPGLTPQSLKAGQVIVLP
jgi:5'-nucleotidase / UDP-sugar diphosphatase